jgi:hypothetical protein
MLPRGVTVIVFVCVFFTSTIVTLAVNAGHAFGATPPPWCTVPSGQNSSAGAAAVVMPVVVEKVTPDCRSLSGPSTFGFVSRLLSLPVPSG